MVADILCYYSNIPLEISQQIFLIHAGVSQKFKILRCIFLLVSDELHMIIE